MIYLDSAATTMQKPQSVARAAAMAMGTMASPGRGGHRPGMLAAEAMFRCRQLAAELFHVSDPEHVILTYNATHGLNIAIHSLVGPGGTAVISGYEHNAVTRPLAAIPNGKVRVAAAPLFDRDGVLDAFDRATSKGADVVICNHVSNVFGFVQPVEEIAAMCVRRGIPFVLDASQSAGTLPVNMEALQAAYIAMPGHKGLYGPQGTGLLLCGEGRCRCHCSRAERAACPPFRRCRTFCRIGWKQGHKMSLERLDWLLECSSSSKRDWHGLPLTNGGLTGG